MSNHRDWQEERDQVLKWIESQHEAISISSFEWNGVKLEHDGFWFKADGHKFASWDHALDYALILNEDKETAERNK